MTQCEGAITPPPPERPADIGPAKRRRANAGPVAIGLAAGLALVLLAACGGGGTDTVLDPNAGGVTPTPEVPVVPANITPPAFTPARWTLQWQDEFSADGLPSSAAWQPDTAFNASGWFNHELQYYAANRSKNARVASGQLVIEAHKEDIAAADSGGQHYTSARLLSRAAWGASVVEIRALLPCGRGTWPALWMLPAAAGASWPGDGEIDIMEHVGYDPGRVWTTVHTAAYNHLLGTQKSQSTAVPTACGAFHRYQLLRDEQKLQFAIDDQLVYQFDNDGTGRRTWPFDQPFRLILNLAVGGDWGGAQGVDDSAFPQRLVIDHVRVFAP
jgi:beta-glucanase (GH16 family)